jgi:hypothetical protein
MVCSYCGLPTDGGQNHGTTEQCVQALAIEARRLRGEREPPACPPGEIGRDSAGLADHDEQLEPNGG